MKELKVGDKVRISKNGKATNNMYGLLDDMNPFLGTVGCVEYWCGDDDVMLVENERRSWHPDDLTPLDKPSIDLLQVGDVVRLRNGVIKMVTRTEQAYVDYLFHDWHNRVGCSHDNFYDNSLKSHKGLPELDIMAIYSVGNLDNIISQSTEGLRLVWERQELPPAEQAVIDAEKAMAEAGKKLAEAKEMLEKDRAG